MAKPASQRTDAEKQQLMRELQGQDKSISGSRLQESRISSSPKSQGNSFSPQEMDMLLGVVNKAQDITAEMLKGIREGNFHLTETALQQVAESNRASMQLTQAVLTQQKPQFVPIQRANFAQPQPYPRQRNWLRNEWGESQGLESIKNKAKEPNKCEGLVSKNDIGMISIYTKDQQNVCSFEGSWENVNFSRGIDESHTLYKQIIKSVNFMQKSRTAKYILDFAFRNKITASIYEDNENKLDPWAKAEIRWNPLRAVRTWFRAAPSKIYYSNPAYGLFHEFTHLRRSILDDGCYAQDYYTKFDNTKIVPNKDNWGDFSDLEEYRVIQILHTIITPELKKAGVVNPPDQIAHNGDAQYVDDVLTLAS